MLPLFPIIAGVFGAAGIALAAAGAHATPRAGLESAANILLFHALAILAGTLFCFRACYLGNSP